MNIKKKPKQVAVLLAILLNMSSVLADDRNAKNCVYDGMPVAPYESVWIDDPVLVKEFMAHHKSSGMTESDIQKRLKHSDWTGFRLVCHPIISYQALTSPEFPAEGFTITAYALTFNEYSMDFYLSIQEQIKEKSRPTSP